ncbi:hypothetical protein OCH239_20895 [Roseivivax halodurans JCM 10272]|uniref:Uncharacterized protein n=1 Tax=Roseivivax halodurans JCM 10272 TaxID=1449350 RepID=X7EFR8_9RHOB|nr:hypothetical protein [Roseivivax halodurans]ETX14894.1 hypothetical protein OCH239_20895 [Roseivivax halodurans JCM 10272]
MLTSLPLPKSLVRPFGRFARDEAGAVTADWVLLTAAVIGIAVAVTAIFAPAFAPLPQTIADSIQTHNDTIFGADEDG